MPDLLREQFPHFRPIVEAFGYRNLEFEGWEADDVIATLATRADAAGIKTCVVSTDRDAFQLCTENVCLMMTPRGVADVNVYTPERVEARYGVTPEQVPDFIGLKGDTSRQHPRRPGHRRQDRRPADRAVRLARGRDRARRRALAGAAQEHHRARRPGARRRRSSRRCGATSTSTATRPQLVLAPPDRVAAEGDLPPLRVPRPAEPRRRARRRGAGGAARGDRRRGAVARGRARPVRGVVGYAADGDRAAVATGDEVVVGPRRRRPPSTRELVVHDAKALARRRSRRHAARRLPDRSRPRLLRARRPRRRVRRRAAADAGGRGGDDGARARAPRRRAGSSARCSSGSTSAASTDLYRDVELPLTERARRRWRRPA